MSETWGGVEESLVGILGGGIRIGCFQDGGLENAGEVIVGILD